MRDSLHLLKQVNAALQRTTGVRLTRETPEQRREHTKKAANAAARATERQSAASYTGFARSGTLLALPWQS